MTPEQLNNLKQQVIEAFVMHELGKELLFSDKVYDDKLRRVMEEDPEFNIYEFTNKFDDSEYIPHRSGMQDLEKVPCHDLSILWNKEDGNHKLPKWDGSSLVIYYTRGRLVRILSMRDKDSGIDQTEKFRSFVPERVDNRISYIRCECLVDTSLDDNARGKANGLVNSKYKQDEIEEKATLMAFCSHDLNGRKMPFEDFKALEKYNKYRENGIPYFMVSPEVQDLVLERGTASMSNDLRKFTFSIDGIVYYEKNLAHKYDYINSAITKVLGINWGETDREGFFPTISVEPVELDGAIIRNPSSNGVPNMIKMGIGVGCSVEVIRSGVTIPKIVDVIDPTEFVYPVCPHCGRQMTENDLYGANLKCGNPLCQKKIDTRRSKLDYWSSEEGCTKQLVADYIKEHFEEIFLDYLNVSRFKYEDKRHDDLIDQNEMLNLVLDGSDESLEEFRTKLGDQYDWTELQWDEAYLNIPSTFRVFHEFLTE